jgi:hypothetical protein
MPRAPTRRAIFSAAFCSAAGSGFFFVRSSSVAFITAPLPLNARLNDKDWKPLKFAFPKAKP